jgi:hypothetical protein
MLLTFRPKSEIKSVKGVQVFVSLERKESLEKFGLDQRSGEKNHNPAAKQKACE